LEERNVSQNERKRLPGGWFVWSIIALPSVHPQLIHITLGVLRASFPSILITRMKKKKKKGMSKHPGENDWSLSINLLKTQITEYLLLSPIDRYVFISHMKNPLFVFFIVTHNGNT
jgi:hypothetical protein